MWTKCKWNYRRNNDHDNVDTVAVGETLDIKPEGLGDCEFFGINEKSGFDE